MAGAGSGKTEVMARRIAWWVAVDGTPKDTIIAFTFTEKAAEEMKFRIRKWVGAITPEGEDSTLGGMYVGTIHGFCLRILQDLLPNVYGVFDIVDDTSRLALVQRWFHSVLGLSELSAALGEGQFESIRKFLRGYYLLHECGIFRATGPEGARPPIGRGEHDWIMGWQLHTDVGADQVSKAFAVSAARYYGALQARRLLDFSTAQSELCNLLGKRPTLLTALRARFRRLVVDEVQDINPVQGQLVDLLVGKEGILTAVVDHRQAIYGWRGGRVEMMGHLHAKLEASSDGDVIQLPDNFRSTDRVISLANVWARTITPPGTLRTPDMIKGNTDRLDRNPSHVAFRRFSSRGAEADWIAATIGRLVDQGGGGGGGGARCGCSR